MADQFQIVPNNFAMSPTINTNSPVMVEILKGHALYSLLTRTVNIPSAYLRQLWSTIHLVPEFESDDFETPGKAEHLVFQINDTTLALELSDLYSVLELPIHDSVVGKSVFD